MAPRTVKCDVCGQAVKRENVVAHIEKVHPREKDALRRATNAEREMVQTGEIDRVRRSGAPARRTAAILAVLVLLIAGGAAVFLLLPTGRSDCVNDVAVIYHIHPHLNITALGVPQTIPADIGVAPGCTHALHTHDASGAIHVESPVARDFTLGEFFQVWEQPLSSDRVWNYGPASGYTVRMTVNGVPSTAYGGLVLRDNQWIDIFYEAE